MTHKFNLRFIFFLALYILVLTIALRAILSGSTPFWHDPARDLLHGIKNQTDPTLIGPPTGIEGIFYGPYWIWIISLIQFFTKDPRIITILVQVLPFFTIILWVLYKLSSQFQKNNLFANWLLFALATITFTTYLWNPHLSLVFLVLLVWRLGVSPKSNSFIEGLLVGLVANFHMSIGLITLISSFLFLLVKPIFGGKPKIKNYLKQVFIALITFILGIFITILPFLTFEIRHNGLQTKAFINNLTIEKKLSDELITQGGLDKLSILTSLLDRSGRILFTESKLGYLVTLLAIGILFFYVYKKQLSQVHLRIFIFINLFTLVLFGIYFSTNNPVWDYHFIGVEVVYLFLFILASHYSKLFKWLIWIFVFLAVITNTKKLITQFQENPLGIPSIASKQNIVEIIFKDAASSDFGWRAFSPGIYTTDFEYMFLWLDRKYESNILLDENPDLVYLIIPHTAESFYLDFINYKTPNEMYTTTKTWKTDDYTSILRREKLIK